MTVCVPWPATGTVEPVDVPDVDGVDGAGLLEAGGLVVSVPAGLRLPVSLGELVEVDVGAGVVVFDAALVLLTGAFVNHSTLIGTPLTTALFEAATTEFCDVVDWLEEGCVGVKSV
jgi:hypothetical protein